MWHSFGGTGAKKPPMKGEVPAKRAEGFRSSTPQGRGGSVSRRDHDQAYWAYYSEVPKVK